MFPSHTTNEKQRRQFSARSACLGSPTIRTAPPLKEERKKPMPTLRARRGGRQTTPLCVEQKQTNPPTSQNKFFNVLISIWLSSPFRFCANHLTSRKRKPCRQPCHVNGDGRTCAARTLAKHDRRGHGIEYSLFLPPPWFRSTLSRPCLHHKVDMPFQFQILPFPTI